MSTPQKVPLIMVPGDGAQQNDHHPGTSSPEAVYTAASNSATNVHELVRYDIPL